MSTEMKKPGALPYDQLTALSSVDGRYRTAAEALVPYVSEYALIKYRVHVECEYFIALSEGNVGLREFTEKEKNALRRIASDFSLDDARIVKKIEREGLGGRPATNHDVKAVEYLIKDKLLGTPLEKVSEWIHFGLTSEDVNSIAYGMMLRGALEEVLLPRFERARASLERLALENAAEPMLARTHGQSASPTTFGKEIRVFERRLARQLLYLRSNAILVKLSGATGNYSAHLAGAPKSDWPAFARAFVARLSDGYEIQLELNEVTTQIEPHDTYAELFDCLRRVNTVLIDLSQDMWRYISDGWITQKPKEGEVSSSTMPHKVNPIDFENAEGNWGVSNALFEHFSRKLPISRLQRDLSDSTVERVIGTAFAHSLVGLSSLERGLSKISVNAPAMLSALASHPEVLAEALQSALRVAGVAVPYERLKELTRGREVTLGDFAAFIDSLDISDELRARLKALRPENYIGLAERIARGD
ncbi:MAG TPA: adenylosuccinate lyase [Candidatus Paceibacterota bacterium]